MTKKNWSNPTLEQLGLESTEEGTQGTRCDHTWDGNPQPCPEGKEDECFNGGHLCS